MPYFFFLYQSPASSFGTVFDVVKTNINKDPSINSVFEDFKGLVKLSY